MNVAIALAVALAAGANAEPLVMGFDQVLRSAVVVARAENARADIAARQLAYLEELDKPRWEIRPVVSLFGFTNPLLLATSFSTGLPWNRRTAPGPAALAAARFDALATEIAADGLRARVVSDAARDYLDLLEKQQVLRQADGLLAARRRHLAVTQSQLEAGRITILDRNSVEQEMVDMEIRVLDAESERAVASLRLATRLGLGSASIEVKEVEILNGRWDRPVAPVPVLVESAIENRTAPKLLREKIEALRAETGRDRAGKPSLSAGFARVSQSPGLVSEAGRGALLGGNIGRIDLGFAIPLKKSGEKDAANQLAAARIRLLDLELERQEREIRSEVQNLGELAATSLKRMELAAKKLDLATRMVAAVQARVNNGLAAPAALMAAEKSLLEAEWTDSRARTARKANVFALVAVCGLDERSTQTQARLISMQEGQ